MDGERVREALREHGVVVAYLFGSRATGTTTLASDHDIAVLFAEPPHVSTVGVIADHLGGVLGTPVDVVDLDRASIELRGRVAGEGRLLLSDDESRRVAFEVHARNRWFDFRPMLEATSEGFLRRVTRQGLR